LILIQAEVLDGLILAEDRRLGYAEARRNLVTRGIDLNALVGQRFRVGEPSASVSGCASLAHTSSHSPLRASSGA
jgi:MOSC domain-containing protein YiiM